MENVRFLLLAALIFLGFLLWQAWQEDFAPTEISQPASPPIATTSPGSVETDDRPQATVGGAAPPASAMTAPALTSGHRIVAETDVLRVEIDTRGGDLRSVQLLQYPQSLGEVAEPVELLADGNGRFFVAQSGILAAEGMAPDHLADFSIDQASYRLVDGADSLVVPLTWESASGVKITKTYVLHRGRYDVDLTYQVENGTQATWQGRPYSQLQRSDAESKGGSFFMPQSYVGGAYYDGKYHKLDFGDLDEEALDTEITGGWAAMLQHYFVAAVIPPPEIVNRYYGKTLSGNRYLMGFVSSTESVEPGGTISFGNRVYAGPKAQDALGDIAPGLELTVDYGIFTIIAQPLFLVLSWFHALVGNWGLSIIILTFVIKLAFYKLSESQYRSMAKMRQFAPRIQALRERFGDDRQKLNEAMMELYRKEKFNPLGGCLPLLVQMPVFISLYWVLSESVELRQAPFLLWVDDLSNPDPYYVLPILFGVSMWAQQKLSAAQATMDPIQQRVMMFMPVGLTVFFALFPSGLVLYWLVNNVLSIIQQWYITRKVDAETGKTQPAT
ncbi:MAG: membrane protein insertase YidC [Pseudomonadota bacterium]|nr:membrane protein insertase YidC [Pseudomonadota bacterium]